MTPFLIICVLCAFIYYIFVRPFRYWTNKGVPQYSIPKQWRGLLSVLLQQTSVGDALKAIYEHFPDVRYLGIYQLTKPLLVLKDPELIKQITVKDFDHFVDHNIFVTEDLDPLWGKNLISLKGDKWKEMRATLSPSFTSSKMKGMFGLMSECAENFVEYFKSQNSGIVTIEFKDALTRYANDIIASASFGISCNSLKDRDNEFYHMGKQVTNFGGFWRNISFFVMIFTPRLAKFLGLRIFNDNVSSFFRNLVIGNMEQREKSSIVRPDMIHLLMQARKGKLKHENDSDSVVDSGFAVIEESAIGKEEKMQKRLLTDDDITAQALIFFFAGFETVSTLMCFCVYELAVNPDVQEKLRIEVDKTLAECKGKLTYETLVKMVYLDMVISETLRKWPSNVLSDRLCVKPYTIQPEKEGEKPIHLKEGDVIYLLFYAMHRDKNFFPEPERFDPERFNNENKTDISPYMYAPFGVGPRSCIGNRFGLLETKILFFYILKNFEIVVTSKSVLPMKLSPSQVTLTAEGGFWFGLRPRNLIS